MVKEFGPWLIGIGVLLVIAGILTLTGAMSWFGNLPGDIRITTERTRVFVPITSMLLISVVLSLLAWFVLRLLQR